MDWIIFYHYISRQGIKFITSPNKTTDHLDMRPSIDGTETDVPILLPIHISFFRPDPKTRDLKSLVVWRSQKPIQSQTPLFLEGPMILRESGSQTNWLQVNQTNNQPTNQTNNQTNKQTNKQFQPFKRFGPLLFFEEHRSNHSIPNACQVQRSPSQGGDLLEPLLRFSERLLGPDLEVRTPQMKV